MEILPLHSSANGFESRSGRQWRNYSRSLIFYAQGNGVIMRNMGNNMGNWQVGYKSTIAECKTSVFSETVRASILLRTCLYHIIPKCIIDSTEIPTLPKRNYYKAQARIPKVR